MARIAPIVPAETDTLCEHCGYMLSGLARENNCPECGEPIEHSTSDARRFPPAWENPGGHAVLAFLQTTAVILFRPTHFFKTLTTRGPIAPAKHFAQLHWLLAALFFGAAASVHARWYFQLSGERMPSIWFALLTALLIAATDVFLLGVTRLAAKLTNLEATYRGLRLPIGPVLRGMYYHAAHYLPVALGAMLTTVGYTTLADRGAFGAQSATAYLYTLCGEVIVAAAYLFHTYWIGMRNMMYANR